MSITRLILAIVGVALVVFGAIDLIHAALFFGAILIIAGLVIIGFARGGLGNLRL